LELMYRSGIQCRSVSSRVVCKHNRIRTGNHRHNSIHNVPLVGREAGYTGLGYWGVLGMSVWVW
jgi:hypothetical protein